jgi:hypothetical protein
VKFRYSVLAAFLLAPGLDYSIAQPNQQPSPAYAQLEREAAVIEALAGKSAPQFRADALLRLSELPPGLPPERVTKLVDTAFKGASQAADRYPMEPVPIGFTDTVPAMAAISSREMLLDQLSLMLRATWRMLRVDPRRALQMFGEIRLPRPAPSTCSSLEVPDVHWYFELARDLAEKSFPQDPVHTRDVDGFLRQVIDGISAPGEIFPAIGLVAGAQVPANSRRGLVDC